MTEIQIGLGKSPVTLPLSMLNRHGLIAGATGTGKTVTLKVLAEQLSLAGVPVFLADIKGDLSNIAKEGQLTDKLRQRLAKIGVTDYQPQAFPVRLWDVFGQFGHPTRATITEMGPLILSRLLGLNETQTGILTIAFKVADEKGWLLIDLKDLKALLKEVYDHASDYSAQYGNIAKQSVAAIQRSLLALEEEGGDIFFGEPALELADFMVVDGDNQGMVNILNATKLFQSPTLYATFLMWLLSELYETLPEVGDLDKPKFVFFFDEAHLLFKDAPKAFVEKIEQMVRLIRSKGVGIFFITQNPLDLPESILAQLGNRVQHALRAYTPKEIKAVKTAADTFRQNPEIATAEAITTLEVGEALISFLTPEAQPSVVERAFIMPPQSSFEPLSAMETQALINQSPLYDKYAEAVDRESAHELLAVKLEKELSHKAADEQKKADEKAAKEAEKEARRQARKPKSEFEKVRDIFLNSAIRTVSRELVRGILGSLRKR
ncbi:helicase HerA-like domain-containing protein [Streptococcus hyovaginalis]|uniref:helicase HerA-like domain-containing protein n=1 Tax=Streptococcus hyovaginalis TaxID=149015 RepID=UPI002A8186A0|nr:helicase HerA-like domain-containing protein [Streptococcus hyovaginalis]MDY4510344.1 helicase HerA-like domain-containing protein [Streptococcus hyovaginalis]